jgi:hypothetical protein
MNKDTVHQNHSSTHSSTNSSTHRKLYTKMMCISVNQTIFWVKYEQRHGPPKPQLNPQKIIYENDVYFSKSDHFLSKIWTKTRSTKTTAQPTAQPTENYIRKWCVFIQNYKFYKKMTYFSVSKQYSSFGIPILHFIGYLQK